MKCRNCGTEIADKALICFRCGTATTEAKFKAPPAAGRRGLPRAVIVAIVLALLVLLAFFLLHSRVMTTDARPEGQTPELIARAYETPDVRLDASDLRVTPGRGEARITAELAERAETFPMRPCELCGFCGQRSWLPGLCL